MNCSCFWGVGLRRLARLVAGAALLAASAWSNAVAAGPVADYEGALAKAYAPYRAALFQTNQKDKAATEAALQSFEAGWVSLTARYRTAPPPQYADDTRWGETLAAVDAILSKSKSEVARGELGAAHDTLEAVRDKLGELRHRNGVVTFSDRMDAYHHQMEALLAGKYSGPDGIGRLRDSAAVLDYLAEQVEKGAPVALRGEDGFNGLLAPMVASAKAVLEAARSSDAPAIEKAMKALKPAFSRFFLRYG